MKFTCLFQLWLSFFWRIFFGVSITLWRCPTAIFFQHEAFLSVILCHVNKSVHNLILYAYIYITLRFYHTGLCDSLFHYLPWLNSSHIFQGKLVFIKSSLCSDCLDLLLVFNVTAIICSSIVCQIKQEIYISLSSSR